MHQRKLCVGVDEAVFGLFPHARIHLLVARGLDNAQRPSGFEAEFKRRERAAARRHRDLDRGHPFLTSWRNAYRAFGTDPRANTPAAEALVRRLRKTGTLPNIWWLVDSYNLASVIHLLPMGGYDLSKIRGDISLTRARGDEHFVPLGRVGEVEHPRHGEVVYRDHEHILTRHWNHRDSETAALDNSTTSALFFCEAADAVIPDEALVQAIRELADLIGASTSLVTHCLDASRREATLHA